MPLVPAYSRGIKRIWDAVNVLQVREQLLPEEYLDFKTYKDDNSAMLKLLKRLCSDITISSPSRRFISLVVSSFNMYVFGLPRMTSKDVFAFV